MTRHHRWTMLLAALVVVAIPVSAEESEPPDAEINPLTGRIEAVDSVQHDSRWIVRLAVDPGRGRPALATIVSKLDDNLDAYGPRIAFRPNGELGVVWWQTKSGNVEVRYKARDPLTGEWSTDKRISREHEDSRHPEILADDDQFWIAFVFDEKDDGGTGIAVRGVRDGAEPFPTRTVLDVTGFSGDIEALPHTDAGHTWVTWVYSDTEVGWSEYDAAGDTWGLASYESYAADDVEAARERIRQQVLQGTP